MTSTYNIIIRAPSIAYMMCICMRDMRDFACGCACWSSEAGCTPCCVAVSTPSLELDLAHSDAEIQIERAQPSGGRLYLCKRTDQGERSERQV